MSKIKEADFIEPIFTHKIGRHSSKPSHAYPVIRLPLKFKSLAGRTAHVYQTHNNCKLAFLITVDEEVGNFVATSLDLGTESRISTLENKIQLLENTLITNRDVCSLKNEKDKKTKGRGRDSNPRRGLHRAIGLPGYTTSENI